MASPSASDRSETKRAIMEATYRAIREHGYAGLTMQAIAREYGKTTAAIHYHYETKEELVSSFLEYLLDQFVDHVHSVDTTDPEKRLDLLLDRLLTDRGDHQDFLIAMLEMRAQAPYNETIREQLQHNEEYVRYLLRTVIRDGQEAGVFAEVDPDRATRTLMMIVDGARIRYVTLGDEDTLRRARRAADEYVEAFLLTG